MVELEACFLSIYLSLIWRRVRSKMTSYSKTATTIFCFVLFVCFVALRPKSTAMVIGGRSFHLTTLFPGQA